MIRGKGISLVEPRSEDCRFVAPTKAQNADLGVSFGFHVLDKLRYLLGL